MVCGRTLPRYTLDPDVALQKVVGLGLQLLFLAFTIVSLSSRAPRRSMRNTIDDILRVRGLLPRKKIQIINDTQKFLSVTSN